MQPDRTMLLHVGYHKTASTWLQRHLFSDADAGFRMPWAFDDIINTIVRPHALHWSIEDASQALCDRRAPDDRQNLIDVMSCEELSGNPHAGGLLAAEYAQRLAALFPEARVLIVIREQVSMMTSTYKQYVRRGGVLSPRRYFQPPAWHFRMPGYRFEHHQYHKLIARYQSLFGADRVCVLAMEQFIEEPAAFLGAITAFAGGRTSEMRAHARERVSLSAWTTAMQRRLNRLFQRDDVNPGGHVRMQSLPRLMNVIDRVLAPCSRGADARLRENVRVWSIGQFAKSNIETALLTGLDLCRYGYDMGSQSGT